MMPESRNCPTCGAELPEAPGAPCVHCLLWLATGQAAQRQLPVGGPEESFGDYTLLEEIARGGMGVIYKARHLSLNRLVALKMILTGQLAGENEVRRFRTEAEAGANLSHPNIVPIYEIGERDGRHYFSMKLVQGESLGRQILKGRWNIDDRNKKELQRAIASLMSKVALAVHHAHQHGVLHRDLKPSNILI